MLFDVEAGYQQEAGIRQAVESSAWKRTCVKGDAERSVEGSRFGTAEAITAA